MALNTSAPWNHVLHRCETRDALCSDAAARFVELARGRLSAAERFSVALAGGTTPLQMFEQLARDHQDAIDWSRVEFFWGDERPVPPEHAESNFRMAKLNLLEPLGIEEERIHRMEGERSDLELAARDYEKNLRAVLPKSQEGIPVLDLVLLGMGDDAHTASLFPGSSAINESDRLVVSNFVRKLDAHRITMTYPLINSARTAMFVVASESKADALVTVLEGPRDVRKYPAQGIGGDVFVEWWVDSAAAAKLPS